MYVVKCEEMKGESTRNFTRITVAALVAGAAALVQAGPAAASEVRHFRVGIQTVDDGGGTQEGDVEYARYASFGGGASPWSNDANTYDPDGVRLVLDFAPSGVLRDRDFRIGAQATDNGLTRDGPVRWTPWASQGGGPSPYAFDGNRYDPDGIVVGIDVY